MKKKSIHLPELLAPAGSFAHLKAAIAAGADAIYMGGRRFGARAFAENASTQEMVDALHYAHFYDRKIYLTVNTLMKEEELAGELEGFLAPFYEAGLDGVIVQDLGVAWKIGSWFPDLPIHASTQMTVTDPCGARAAKKLGMCRVVPARELSLAEIRAIKETGVEVEVFIHGALCYSYSGQCLMSSNYGGRSGNRGQCAQPCRLPYDLLDPSGKLIRSGLHLLSPRDLCALPLLPSLLEAGVDSLKIEGRMKNVEYVAGVTAIYRKYLDRLRDAGITEIDPGTMEANSGKTKANPGTMEADSRTMEVDPGDMEILAELYQREGFTQGYFFRHNGPDMMATREPRNTGRKIGEVDSVKKNRVTIALSDTEKNHSRAERPEKKAGTRIVTPGDILIIPLPGKKEDRGNRVSGKKTPTKNDQNGQELVLTVPSDLEASSFKRKGTWFITLNAPGAGRLKKGMAVYRRYNQSLQREIREKYVDHPVKLPVHAHFQARIGQPVQLTLSCQDNRIRIEGPVGQIPLKSPLTEEDVKKQFSRTGEEPFRLDRLEIEMEEDIFLPLSGLKDFRRQAYQALRREIENRYDREKYSMNPASADNRMEEIDRNPKENRPRSGDNPDRIVTVYNQEILLYILGQSFARVICLPAEFFSDRELKENALRIREAGLAVRLSLPRVFREKMEEEKGRHDRERDLLVSGLFDEVEIHNINQAQFIRDLYQSDDYSGKRMPIVAGMSFYQWNRGALQAVEHLFPQIRSRVLPAELSPEEGAALSRSDRQETECLVYGRYPLMISAQCLNKTVGRCRHCHEVLTLCRDQKVRMPVSTHCSMCYNLIWRDRPVDRIRELREGQIPAGRYLFDTFGNSLEEVKAMIKKTGVRHD